MLLESSLVAKLGSSLVAYWKDRSIHEHQKKSEKQAEETQKTAGLDYSCKQCERKSFVDVDALNLKAA